ncbi:ABC transporter permease subunit [Pseudomonas sp. ABC1]|uniref:ABC transporter permease n=1 Tax=Pseudomonas sp. ABC1 TaxID=2748080 RepID=UPI0015C3A834|nr:ABC transporter permease subunit [Pseudomonas sp. ABC1]QLF93222.1 ABC transporter permease subunit [Pseudomonas sp. ABC1]
MSQRPIPSRRRTAPGWAVVGVLALLLGWQYLASHSSPLLMATPLETLQALLRLATDAQARQQAWTTLGRIATGVSLGCLLGFSLGVLAGLDARLRGLLEPLRWLLMAIPPVVVVVLAMLWFGLGTRMVVFISILMLAPGMYVNTVKGMLLVDRNLTEMVTVYRLSAWQRLRHLYVPALAAPLSSALLIATCGGVRLIVMAELLGAEDGVGYALANARSILDNAGIYAWALLVLLWVALLEFALLQPIQRRLCAWQENGHA